MSFSKGRTIVAVCWLLSCAVLASCGTPIDVEMLAEATGTPSQNASPTPIPATPTAPLGSEENPLVLALPPSTRPQGTVLEAGDALTSLLRRNTGYEFVSVIPPSESELVKAFENGNAHIGALSPFAYLLVSDHQDAEAAFARELDGDTFYGAELIAPGEPDYIPYFDPVGQENIAEADIALTQFANKKPCWTDPRSASGHVVPLGVLKRAGISTREPAFLASHPAVVRALYAGGICDFGGTYVNAIAYPGLEDELPDVTKRIVPIWRIAPIIPYETLVFSRDLPVEMRRLLTRTFVDLMATEDGRSAMQTLYGFGAMQVTTDGQYSDFRDAVEASGLSLDALLDP